MARALKDSVRELFREARKNYSGMRRILSPSSDGAGCRVFPPQHGKKDIKIGVRFDEGLSIDGKVELNLQINSNAEKSTLKELVRKHGSHKKYVVIKIDPNQAVTEENLDKLEDEVCQKIDSSGIF